MKNIFHLNKKLIHNLHLIIIILILHLKLIMSIDKSIFNNNNMASMCESYSENNIHPNKYPFFYTFTHLHDQCNVTCQILVTTLPPNFGDIFYDDTEHITLNLPNGIYCKDTVHSCQNGLCSPLNGRLEINIHSAFHNYSDQDEPDKLPDPFVELRIGDFYDTTEVQNNTYSPIFLQNTQFIYQNVSADQKILLLLKDKDPEFDDWIGHITITPAQIIANNWIGKKHFYQFPNTNQFGISAIVHFEIIKEHS